MADDRVKDLEAKLAALSAERDELKTQLAKSRKELTMRDRTSVVEILGGKDKGRSWIGKEIAVGGWVRTTRNADAGKLLFIELSDGTVQASLQAIASKEKVGQEKLDELHTKHADKPGASLFVVGTIVASPAAGQAVELLADKITVLGGADPNGYPLAKKAHSLEFLRDVGHLRARTKTISAMLRVRNALAFGTHKFFQENGYFYCHTPLLTASDCEGAGEMFQVTTLLKGIQTVDKMPVTKDGKLDYSRDFFKRPAFLAVSGQLNVETYACAMSKMYTFGPTFRAEDSHTTRHLAEFWMIEPEIAFADLAEDADMAEAYVKSTVRYAMQTVPQDIEYFENLEAAAQKEAEKETAKAQMQANKEKKAQQRQQQQKKKVADAAGDAPADVAEPAKHAEKPAKPAQSIKAADVLARAEWMHKKLRERLQNTLDEPFQRITYTQAVEILTKAVAEGKIVFDEPCEWGRDLKSEMERYIAEVVYQKPVIIMNYPKEIKAFYMRLNGDDKTVAAMDILVPGIGEIVGGSQREERLDVLEQRIKAAKLDPEQYSWYLDLRRFGTVPHAGFGLGFERLVRYVTGLENIRDTIPFPRWPGHCDF